MSESMQKTILVVDDDTELVNLLSLRLAKAGYSVLGAFDGEEGLNIAREKKPDLIILDVMMPQMDGFHVCRLLKFDLKTDRIPIMMLTARTTPKDHALGINVGANAYMTKPFETHEFLQNVENLLKSS